MSKLISIDPELILDSSRRPELFALFKSLTEELKQSNTSSTRPSKPFNTVWLTEPTREDLATAWADESRFCPVCLRFSRDVAVFAKGREAAPSDTNEWITWRVDLAELADAAERGCCFCGFLASRFFNNSISMWAWGLGISASPLLECCRLAEGRPGPDVIKAVVRLRELGYKYGPVWFDMKAQPVDYDVATRTYALLKIAGFGTNLRDLGFGDEAINDVLDTRREIIIEAYAMPDDPSKSFLRNQPINTSPGSESSFSEVHGWLEDCLNNHTSCPKPEIGRLPTRVIEILDDDNLRITSGDGEGHYAALSYCWGGEQTFVATTDRLSSMKRGFSTSDLPQTLQDAVKATLRLGLQYLWVDALCILQDSSDDKTAEIERMSAYYKNAYVTLAAGFSNSRSGFLRSRGVCEVHTQIISSSDDNEGQSSSPLLPRDLLEMRVLCADGSIGTMLFREEMPYRMSEEPLMRRGWTLQERVLSPRTLFYGFQNIWQCREKQVSSGGRQDWVDDFRTMGNRKIQLELGGGPGYPSQATTDGLKDTADSKTMESNDKERHSELSSSDALLDTWYRAVEEYSYRELSLTEDKLPAISAIAAEVASLSVFDHSTPGTKGYVAGLWYPDILRGLLWSTYPTMVLKRPATWRAPTWSWASTDNVISYSRLKPAPHAKPVATVLRCEVQPKAAMLPFSEVVQEGSELVLRAPVLRPGKEILESLVKIGNRPNMKGQEYGASWWEEMIDLSERGGAVERDARGWQALEGSICAILFVTVTQSQKGTDPEVETLKNGPESKEKDESDSRKDQAVEANKESKDSEDNTEQNSHGKESEQDNDKGKIRFTGLILAPLEDSDSYERVGPFSFSFPGGQALNVPMDILTII